MMLYDAITKKRPEDAVRKVPLAAPGAVSGKSYSNASDDSRQYFAGGWLPPGQKSPIPEVQTPGTILAQGNAGNAVRSYASEVGAAQMASTPAPIGMAPTAVASPTPGKVATGNPRDIPPMYSFGQGASSSTQIPGESQFFGSATGKLNHSISPTQPMQSSHGPWQAPEEPLHRPYTPMGKGPMSVSVDVDRPIRAMGAGPMMAPLDPDTAIPEKPMADVSKLRMGAGYGSVGSPIQKPNPTMPEEGPDPMGAVLSQKPVGPMARDSAYAKYGPQDPMLQPQARAASAVSGMGAGSPGMGGLLLSSLLRPQGMENMPSPQAQAPQAQAPMPMQQAPAGSRSEAVDPTAEETVRNLRAQATVGQIPDEMSRRILGPGVMNGQMSQDQILGLQAQSNLERGGAPIAQVQDENTARADVDQFVQSAIERRRTDPTVAAERRRVADQQQFNQNYYDQNARLTDQRTQQATDWNKRALAGEFGSEALRYAERAGGTPAGLRGAMGLYNNAQASQAQQDYREQRMEANPKIEEKKEAEEKRVAASRQNRQNLAMQEDRFQRGLPKDEMEAGMFMARNGNAQGGPLMAAISGDRQQAQEMRMLQGQRDQQFALDKRKTDLLEQTAQTNQMIQMLGSDQVANNPQLRQSLVNSIMGRMQPQGQGQGQPQGQPQPQGGGMVDAPVQQPSMQQSLSDLSQLQSDPSVQMIVPDIAATTEDEMYANLARIADHTPQALPDEDTLDKLVRAHSARASTDVNGQYRGKTFGGKMDELSRVPYGQRRQWFMQHRQEAQPASSIGGFEGLNV